jgi:hypothetical protein
MTRIKLSDISDERPVKLTIEIPARLHRDLREYGVVLNAGSVEGAPKPEDLVAPMLSRFIASDRDFARARRAAKTSLAAPNTRSS